MRDTRRPFGRHQHAIMSTSIQSPPSLQQVQAHIDGLQKAGSSEFAEPVKAPGNWKRLLCALHSRGLNLGERGARAFEAVAAYDGKMIERRQMLDGVRSHLSRLGMQDDLRSSGNMTKLLTTNNFWQALGTIANKAIREESRQAVDHQRKALGMAASGRQISNFLSSEAPDSRQSDLVFMKNFSATCQKTYPVAYESGSLTSTELRAVLDQINDAAFG